MTTIACKDNILAVDSQITGRYIEYGTKLYEEDGTYISFCGNYGQALTMMQGFLDGAIEASEGDTTLVVLSADGSLVEILPAGHIIPCKQPYAAGSGAQFAMGAMQAGASADEAVEIATGLDPHSGGDIQIGALDPSDSPV